MITSVAKGAAQETNSFLLTGASEESKALESEPIEIDGEPQERGQRETEEHPRMKIHIPTPLRVYTEKRDTVVVTAGTVGEALSQLTTQHPELKKHLYTEDGKLRSFVNVYLNDEDVRYLPEKDTTAVTESDALTIIPSIAGGAAERAAQKEETDANLS